MFIRKAFKGLIRPHMALGYRDAQRIADRKSMFMVEYLRARRDPIRHCIALHRRWHLQAMKLVRDMNHAKGEPQ